MDANKIEENYTKFRAQLAPYVSEDLLRYIDESDFKTSPASTRESFHGAYEGGLVEHSLGVRTYLAILNRMVKGLYSDAQITRVALLHDLCKAGCYHQEPAWRKVNGEWQSYNKWVFDDPFPAGHGSKSVMLILSHGTELTPEEMLAITHHMGAYGLQGGELATYSQATKKCPLVLLTGWADLFDANIAPFMVKRREGASEN